MSSIRKIPSDEATLPKESVAPVPPAFLEPLDELTNHLLSVVEEIRSLEGKYAMQLKESLAGLRKKAEEQANATLRKEFDAQLKLALEMVKEQFNTKLAEAKREIEAERSAFEQKIEELKRLDRSEPLQAELKQTNEALAAVEGEIAQMVDNPDIELSKIIRLNARQSELKAYLRGLQFHSQAADERGKTPDKETA